MMIIRELFSLFLKLMKYRRRNILKEGKKRMMMLSFRVEE